MSAEPAFLGVSSSLTGRRWKARVVDDRLALALAQGHGLPEIVGRLLAARGVGMEEAERFLNPTLKALMPDPSVLKDMDRAADRIARAIRDGEKVAVFGDYDVDGATSTALLARFFRDVGGSLRVYIPDRIKEGYGPNLPALL
ncbi:MAG: single-stranded-DNA-specific exonuclease RecJ, partial [Pseudomonadota bacterium]